MTPQSTLDATPAETIEPVREYDVCGGGGVTLRAREWGNAAGPPILFVHGWSQSDLCWSAQVGGPLAERFRMVTFDLRGHGASERPLDGGAYTAAQPWADDLAAVIDTTGLERPVLVGWSYGGLVIADYLRAHGEAAIGGIELVGGAVLLRPPSFDHIGPGFLENAPAACDPDLRVSIPAIRRFLGACTACDLGDDVLSTALAWNMVVAPEVRAALIARDLDAEDVLGRLSVPVLVSHGREDAIILPSMAERVLERCPTAVASWYDGVGHMPFLESTERFDRELASFVEEARG